MEKKVWGNKKLVETQVGEWIWTISSTSSLVAEIHLEVVENNNSISTLVLEEVEVSINKDKEVAEKEEEVMVAPITSIMKSLQSHSLTTRM